MCSDLMTRRQQVVLCGLVVVESGVENGYDRPVEGQTPVNDRGWENLYAIAS
jgi:hypothetical protein